MLLKDETEGKFPSKAATEEEKEKLELGTKRNAKKKPTLANSGKMTLFKKET